MSHLPASYTEPPIARAADRAAMAFSILMLLALGFLAGLFYASWLIG